MDLGTSLDLVEHNLDLIRLQEQARVAMFGEKKKEGDKSEESGSVNLLPSDVDKILKELLVVNKDSMEGEMENLDLINFCAAGLDRGLMSKLSSEVFSVKTPIKTVLRRGRKKNVKRICLEF